MSILTAAIVAGPLMLIGAVSVAAGHPPLASGSISPVRLVGDDGSTSDRDAYVRKAQTETQDWQRKLHDLGEKATAKGKEAGEATESDLDAAWAKTEAASRKLQTAGAEGWESAKADFAKASHGLAEAWRKNHLEEK